MRYHDIVCCVLAAGALNACGGSDDAPGTAAACFNPALWGDGATVSMSTRSTFSTGGSAQSEHALKTSLATFNQRPAIGVTARLTTTPDATLAANGWIEPIVSNSVGYYATDPAPDRLVLLGDVTTRAATESSPATQVMTTYGPAVKLGFDLAPGQSLTQPYIETRTSEGSTQARHSDATLKFNGFVTVTVPAGTFRTCEFVETGTFAVDAYAPRSLGTSTTRYGVGNGLLISADLVIGDPWPPTPVPSGSTTSHLELLAATINGQPIAP